MIAVYITDVSPLMKDEVYIYYYNRVGKARQEKADRLTKSEDRARSIGAGAVLRFAVEDYTDHNYDELCFMVDKNGKPYVEENAFYFSLSHSDKYAVCAISDRPVGVDIEKERELSPRFRERFADSIIEWTKKEAKGKLTGRGVLDKNEDGFIYSHHRIEDYIITVCSDEKTDRFLTYVLPYPC